MRAGIDIGGTFTDFLLFDEINNTFTVGKRLTTPDDPARAVIDGLSDLTGDHPATIAAMEQIVHGTTLVTNALIERKGAVTALLTTRGFRDALEIAREHRYDLYDLMLELPDPLVPRSLRFEVDERMLADGTVLEPLDHDSVERAIRAALDAGTEAIAVSLIHSYRNPDHEKAIGEAITAMAPEVTVSLSSDVDPEIREYERTSTTVANVYVRGLTETYLQRLEDALVHAGYSSSLFVMLSSGGLCAVDAAKRFPIRLVESGPAAGALAAAYFGKLTGRPSLLSFDMGGTTAKCCLIGEDGPTSSSEFEVGRVYRFKKGSGLPVSVPVIELIEIGAGGGSIARIDNLGLLKVGPDSAGADPGPACYGRGGTAPTVTDADLVLGYLDPDHFLGGTMKLDVEAARAAIETIAKPLGMSIEAAAWGIHQVVNEQMASAARIHAIERGEDVREFPMFAFGGAGPVHACNVGAILRSPEVIVPFGAGVGSTIGFLVAPVSFDFVRTYVDRIESIDWAYANARLEEMAAEGEAMLANAGIAPADIAVQRIAEMRYVGQGHEIAVELPAGQLSAATLPDLIARFESTYQKLYGRTATGNPIETVNWRVTTAAPAPDLPLERWATNRDSALTEALKGRRAMFVPGSGSLVDVPVFDRYLLSPGDVGTGPMIIEERESTVVVGDGANVTVDPYLSIVVTMPTG